MCVPWNLASPDKRERESLAGAINSGAGGATPRETRRGARGCEEFFQSCGRNVFAAAPEFGSISKRDRHDAATVFADVERVGFLGERHRRGMRQAICNYGRRASRVIEAQDQAGPLEEWTR